MQIWMTLILAVQLISALAMIGLVLLQQGKGADMGASFGSGASGSLFGASGSANFLSRSTAACATLFFACTLALTFMGSSGSTARIGSGGGSVLDAPASTASAASAATPAAGAIPAAAPATPAASAAIPAAPAQAPAPAASK
jgi:preprotein translocase subunit SecG